MPTPSKARAFDWKQALLETYAVNERITQYMLENLADAAWKAEPPGGKGRTIASIAAHIHNVRHMWLAVAAKGKPLPEKLEPTTATRKEAMEALAESAVCCTQLLSEALDHPEGKVKGFRPDAAGMLGYLISHDAHHRGQICMLARQLGYTLPKQAGFGMWEWGSRWKECGFGG